MPGAFRLPWVKEAQDEKGQAVLDTQARYDAVMDMVNLRLAKLQLEGIIQENLGDDTPLASRLFNAQGQLTSLYALLAAVGVGSEIASLGQIDHVTDEIRTFVAASGLTQVTGYGYGQILDTVLGEPLKQELAAKMRHSLVGLPELISTQIRRPSFNPDAPTWDEDLRAQVMRYGLSDERADMLLASYVFYPAVQDWIRFAVRDVFTPEIVQAGGYDELFPVAILDYTRRAGLPDEVTRWYWRAHWQLPSPQMGYEMLHRGLITQDELAALLKVADYAPAWIPRMVDISYAPLTRVDARRMYEAGTIDRARYVKAMQDLGYRPEDAELFASWVDRDKKAADKDLSLAQLRAAFDEGLIPEAEYEAGLAGLGYDTDEAKTIIALGQRAKERKVQTAQVKLAKKRYTYGLSDEAALAADLAAAGVQASEVEGVVKELAIERRTKRKLPSKDDLTGWLKKGVIDTGTFRARMSQIGYTDEDISLYVAAAGSPGEQ